MSLNPDLNKHAQAVIFSRKRVTPIYDLFNNAVVQQSTSQHLGIHLDEKLDFNAHIKEKINKANKGIGLFRKLQNKLPINALLTIHKYFLRLRLDYGDIVYDQSIVYNHPTNDSLGKKLESALYNAALVATGVINETL